MAKTTTSNQSAQQEQKPSIVTKMKDAVGIQTPDYKAQAKDLNKQLMAKDREIAGLNKTIEKAKTVLS